MSACNTPKRNTVVNMTLDWVACNGVNFDTEFHDELGDLFFNGGFEDYDDLEFWEKMKIFKERV